MKLINQSLLVTSGLALLSACGSDDGNTKQPEAKYGIDAQTWAVLADLSPPELPAPPSDPTNGVADDRAAADFGHRLFFEPRFAGRLLDGDNDGSERALGSVGDTGKVACAGCHIPETGFSDTRSLMQQISLAAGWGIRKSPSLLDVSHSKLLMWDGRRDGFFNQVFGVFESPVEGNTSRLFVAYQTFELHRDEYESIFGPMPDFSDRSRFPELTAEQTGCERLDSDSKCVGVQRGAPGDGAEYDGLAEADKNAVTEVVANLGKALGAYQRLLSCGQSRFDEWVAGNADALDEAEQRGALLFVGKAGCADCHNGPFFSDEQFHNVGLKPETVATVFLDDGDEGAYRGLAAALDDELNSEGDFSDGSDGRLPDAVGEDLLGAFRTPRLRCSSERPAFMHTGHVRTLEDVIAFFNRGGDDFGYPGTNELTPLELTPEERDDLAAFLRSLDGPGPDAELLTAPE